jgi:hypothetical protein
VPSRQEAIIILAALSGMPNFVSCFRTQDIFSTPNSSLGDVSRPGKLEAAEACAKVGKSVGVEGALVQAEETKVGLASVELLICLWLSLVVCFGLFVECS